MISVYKAAHLADAQMVVDVLAGEGIVARIFGGALGSAIGELSTDSTPDVRVAAADAPRARSIIAAWEATEVDEPAPAAAAPATRSLMPAFVALIAGVMIGAAGIHLTREYPRRTDVHDYDQDGVVDERSISNDERYIRTEFDRNGDGKVDELLVYGRYGESTTRSDHDFDGEYEMVTEFRKNLPVKATVDYDGDGVIDYRAYFTHGVLEREEHYDAGNEGST